MEVLPGVPAPIQYADATFQVSLFVRAKIYDITTGTPSLENTVNLTQIGTESVYQGLYTFTDSKQYIVIKNVYTDGTYSTVDTTFSMGVDEVQCKSISSSSTTPVQFSESMDITTPSFDMDIEIDPQLVP